jgi:uncharacterized protein (DUF305 family)
MNMTERKKHSLRTGIYIGICLFLTAALPAIAQTVQHMHDKAQPADIYAPAMEEMHKAMQVKPTGDADADFVRGMIPHHEGAVAMAKILLEKGHDPELRKMAEGIIKAQESEISFMKSWLEKNGKK